MRYAPAPKVDLEDLTRYIKEFQVVWKLLQTFNNLEKSVDMLMAKRNYDSPLMRERLIQEGIVYADSSLMQSSMFNSFSEDLGLMYTDKYNGRKHFLLLDRYILPIRDMAGNIVALVGWEDDSKKYITSKSKYFSKNTFFYGLEKIQDKSDVGTFIVEGIFDRLAIESLGGRAFATMGLNTDARKRVLYSLLGRVVAITDADSGGNRVRQEDSWGIPLDSSYLTWRGGFNMGGGVELRPKDIDDLLKIIEPEGARELLRSAYSTRGKRVITYDL